MNRCAACRPITSIFCSITRVIRFEDPDRIFAAGGAMEAFIDAKKAGKIRYIGFTGHKDPHVHLHMLEVARAHGFHFDTVQMPLNVMDAHFRSFEKLVLPELVKQNIGVLGMKSMGSAVILKSNTATPMECLHYALNLPTSVVITGIDSPQILDQAVQAAAELQAAHVAAGGRAILAKTAKAAGAGRVRALQDDRPFRLDRETSRMAGRGTAAERSNSRKASNARAAYASSCFTTFPCTSVSRNGRPGTYRSASCGRSPAGEESSRAGRARGPCPSRR